MPGASINYCGKGNVTTHAVFRHFPRLKKAGPVPICINQTVNFVAVNAVFSDLFEPK